MQKLNAYFFSDYHFKSQTLLFKRLLYLFLIVESIYYLFYFDLFFGANSIVFVTPKSIGFFKGLAFLLYNSESVYLCVCFILMVLMLSVVNLFTQRLNGIADLLLWIMVINIHNRIYPTLTGGNNLLNQFLFLNWFLSASYAVKNNWSSQLRMCLHNFGVIAIMIQICIVYFLSGLAKVNDPEWLSGKAISMVSQIRYFSLYSFLTQTKGLDFVFVFLTYVVLFYQLLFPILVWIKKIKKPLLFIGILMHLYIAFVMGLVSFGFIMILAYVFFWPMKQPES